MSDFESTIYAMLVVSAAPGIEAASWCAATKKPGRKSWVPSAITTCMSGNEERMRDVANLGKKVRGLRLPQATIYEPNF
jgi:hypothetical protein